MKMVVLWVYRVQTPFSDTLTFCMLLNQPVHDCLNESEDDDKPVDSGIHSGISPFLEKDHVFFTRNGSHLILTTESYRGGLGVSDFLRATSSAEVQPTKRCRRSNGRFQSPPTGHLSRKLGARWFFLNGAVEKPRKKPWQMLRKFLLGAWLSR